MSADEAYDYTLSLVEELKKEGLEVSITPSSSALSGKLREKYRGPTRIDSSKWVHVTFYTEDAAIFNRVYSKLNLLRDKGIMFDTGFGLGGIDWELDWSFKYNEDTTESKET